MIDVPLVVQVVSGEYLMLRNGDRVIGDNLGILNELFETLISVKRAGSDRAITYITMDFLKHLAKSVS
jgi:delta-aminolevulinic acid dehydratase/porphobilinogen synthase